MNGPQVAVIPNLEEESIDDSIDPFLPRATKPDDDRNWASDPEIRERVEREILPIIEETRRRMIPLHQEWESIRNMTLMKHDESQRYLGRSNNYIPAFLRARNTVVSNLSRGLFPSDEYLDVTSKERAPDSGEADLAVKTYIQHQFENCAKIKQNIKPALRERADYGIMIVKFWWEKDSKGYKQARLKKLAGGGLGEEYANLKAVPDGLRVSPRSCFNWYCYPLQAQTLEEMTAIFEDIDVPKAFVDEKIRLGEWENIEMSSQLDEVAEHQNDRMAQLGKTIDDPTSGDGSDLAGLPNGEIKTITEIYCHLKLKKAAMMEDEDPECAVPCKLTINGNRVLEVRRNPFWHQTAPYHVDRSDEMIGSFHGKGIGAYSKGLQSLINDNANQTNDNSIMSLNPMVLVNPGTLSAPLSPMKPGGVWNTTDPANGIKFDRPPVEQVQYGLMVGDRLINQLQDLGAGAPDTLQGGGGEKTATGTSIIQRNAMTPLQDMVESIEANILVPLMWDAWVLGQQYEPEEIMTAVAGMPIKVQKKDLVGNFQFRWLASSQAMNQQARAQGAIQLIDIIGRAMPILQQQGYIVDLKPIIERVYTDGHGFRGFDKVIFKMDPMQMQQMQQAGMAGPGGPPPIPPGQRVRSALEQEHGQEGAPSMAPGEGEDFMEVRAQADQMAGQMGEG